jgi:hypothetical protein
VPCVKRLTGGLPWAPEIFPEPLSICADPGLALLPPGGLDSWHVSAPVAAVILLVLALGPVPAGGQPRISVVVGGLEVPWALAFAPDRSLHVTERPGRVRVVRDGRLDPAPVERLAGARRRPDPQVQP